MNKDYYTDAGKNIWNKNKWYKYGWWLFVIGYPFEWGIPALTWPLTFAVKKYIPAIYASWLLFIVSLTWWAVNLGVGALWIVGALTYDDVGGTNDLFSKEEIWILFGVFMGYAVVTNSIYYWLFHRAASHPDPTTIQNEEELSELVPDFFGF